METSSSSSDSESDSDSDSSSSESQTETPKKGKGSTPKKITPSKKPATASKAPTSDEDEETQTPKKKKGGKRLLQTGPVESPSEDEAEVKEKEQEPSPLLSPHIELEKPPPKDLWYQLNRGKPDLRTTLSKDRTLCWKGGRSSIRWLPEWR